MNILEKLKALAAVANSRGVAIPTVRDPKTGAGSITATLVVVSFGVSVLLLLGKVVHLVGEVDYNNVLWLLGISLSAYIGRKFQTNGKDITLE